MSKLCTVEVHHGEVVQREHVSSICGECEVVNGLGVVFAHTVSTDIKSTKIEARLQIPLLSRR